MLSGIQGIGIARGSIPRDYPGPGSEQDARRESTWHPGLAATREDLEARAAALEAERADHRAVLTAVNALGANQREHAIAVKVLQADVAEVKAELRGFRRSTEEGMAGLKDLVIGLRDS